MQRLSRNLLVLFKWIVIAGISGIVVGSLTRAFAFAIEKVKEFRLEHTWIIAGIQFAGLLIVFLYNIAGRSNDKGTNNVVIAVR